jgi:hypothetical protein
MAGQSSKSDASFCFEKTTPKSIALSGAITYVARQFNSPHKTLSGGDNHG